MGFERIRHKDDVTSIPGFQDLRELSQKELESTGPKLIRTFTRHMAGIGSNETNPKWLGASPIIEIRSRKLVPIQDFLPFGGPNSDAADLGKRRGNPCWRSGGDGRRHDAIAAQLLYGRSPRFG